MKINVSVDFCIDAADEGEALTIAEKMARPHIGRLYAWHTTVSRDPLDQHHGFFSRKIYDLPRPKVEMGDH